ncbi:MAG TPA: hypothetical protein DCZ12_05995 [Gammaproteobacteria bacterium]|nr:hypothetical protein [Gammaproteobacteria bacterium]
MTFRKKGLFLAFLYCTPFATYAAATEVLKPIRFGDVYVDPSQPGKISLQGGPGTPDIIKTFTGPLTTVLNPLAGKVKINADPSYRIDVTYPSGTYQMTCPSKPNLTVSEIHLYSDDSDCNLGRTAASCHIYLGGTLDLSNYSPDAYPCSYSTSITVNIEFVIP